MTRPLASVHLYSAAIAGADASNATANESPTPKAARAARAADRHPEWSGVAVVVAISRLVAGYDIVKVIQPASGVNAQDDNERVPWRPVSFVIAKEVFEAIRRGYNPFLRIGESQMRAARKALTFDDV